MHNAKPHLPTNNQTAMEEFRRSYWEMFDRALDALNADEQEVIVIIYMEGYTLELASHIMDKEIAVVQSLVDSACNKIKYQFGQSGSSLETERIFDVLRNESKCVVSPLVGEKVAVTAMRAARSEASGRAAQPISIRVVRP